MRSRAGLWATVPPFADSSSGAVVSIRMAAVALLIVGIVAMFARPFGAPLWLGPTVAAMVGVGIGTTGRHAANETVHLLAEPLLFLVFAVPLAILLDRIGVFAAIAAALGGGRHLVAWLWLFAAGVTIVFNLDAAVVLLTPLYIRIARLHGYSAEMLAFQPALLACLASNPLPVSNLTNLIAADHLHLSVGDFAVHLLVPTVAACLTGWLFFRRTFAVHRSNQAVVNQEVDRTALRRGLPIIGFVLVGFTLGSAASVPEWIVAAMAVVWAAAITLHLPWRAIPYQAVLVAAALAVLVAGAAATLHVARVFDASGVSGRLRALSYGVFASDATNNLPAILAGAPVMHDRTQVWALLIGANVGPVLVLTGALSGLLWRDTASRLGVQISARRYSAVGVRVGLPALLVAATLVVLVSG
jgi:arsenical pump membrane protein